MPLIDDKSTAVRVWTSARLDAAGTPVHGAAVYLYGEKADGTPLPGGPIPAKEGARDIGPALSFGPLIDLPTWSNPASSWTFTLPWSLAADGWADHAARRRQPAHRLSAGERMRQLRVRTTRCG